MSPTRWDPLRELMDLQDRLAKVTGSLGWSDGRGGVSITRRFAGSSGLASAWPG
jgi:hypothetical protein